MGLKIYIFILFSAFPLFISAQKSSVIEEKIVWTSITSDTIAQHLAFDKAGSAPGGKAPIYLYHNIPGQRGNIVKAKLTVLSSSSAENFYLDEWKEEMPAQPELIVENLGIKNPNVIAYFSPFYVVNNTVQKVDEYSIEYNYQSAPTPKKGNNFPKYSSVLSSGEIYKIGIPADGIYKVDYNFFTSELGLNLSGINPHNIKFYSSGGGINAISFEERKFDDLEEIPVQFFGNSNNAFETGEYFLFFGKDQNSMEFDPTTRLYLQKMNIYDNQSYVFIKLDNSPGKRVQTANTPSAADLISDNIIELVHYEQDKENILHFGIYTHGSGQMWFGDFFSELRTREYANNIQFKNKPSDNQITFQIQFAASTLTNTWLNIYANNQNFRERIPNVSSLNTPSSGDVYRTIYHTNTFTANTGVQNFSVEYERVPGTSYGWLDYINLQASVKNIFQGNKYIMRDHNSLNYSSIGYRLFDIPQNLHIWDISNPFSTNSVAYTTEGNDALFTVKGGELKEIIAFSEAETFLTPQYIERVNNQNLHALTEAELLIIYPKGHEIQAKRLAEHRSNFSQLNVVVVEDTWIYNEFGGGIKEPSAIRNFARMLYERDERFKFLLLFGDGTYDHRNIYGLMPNYDYYLPTFQTFISDNSVESYPADDYYGLLDEPRTTLLGGNLEVGIGRLPVNNERDGQIMVDKIIKYDESSKMLGDWRNRVIFMCDDGDRNKHLADSEKIAKRVDTMHPELNINKVYADAYPQVSTPGGHRFPDINRIIGEEMFKGVLLLNYFGHGGYKSMAQEQIMTKSDVQSWTNSDKLPIFVTATCSFAPYDDIAAQSIGEDIVLKQEGGAIGLFTTTRDVYANYNYDLANSIFNYVFSQENGDALEFGTILKNGKNGSPSSVSNSRKFVLLGDPSQKIALPKHFVRINSFNASAIQEGNEEMVDTILALSKIVIEGELIDVNGHTLDNYNGILTTTIFDKKKKHMTLGQEADQYSPAYSYDLQNNTLFKGKSTIKNGKFTFTCLIPKDIDYSIGPGKISFYAEDTDSNLDANGSFHQFAIGGGSSELNDDTPPIVKVYINNESFVSGGISDKNPKLIANISDDSGINITGNSIGHDIIAVINDENKKTYTLNDFFEAAIDDHTSGKVNYPIYNLEPGHYSMKVRAWDIANNSGEGFTDFIVAQSGEAALDRILNYPNPFSNSTEFQFEHNVPSGFPFELKITIYTVSGKIVKTIQHSGISNGSIHTGIQWNGRDEYNQKLAAGVYIYRIALLSEFGSSTFKGDSEFEKLVIIN